MMTIPDLTPIAFKFGEECCNGNHQNRDTEIYVFPQDWPNTGGGMAEYGYVYGQMFVREYTVVIYSMLMDKAMVWFDGKLGYTINGLTDRFWEDLYNQEMKNRGHARYYAINDNATFNKGEHDK